MAYFALEADRLYIVGRRSVDAKSMTKPQKFWSMKKTLSGYIFFNHLKKKNNENRAKYWPTVDLLSADLGPSRTVSHRQTVCGVRVITV